MIEADWFRHCFGDKVNTKATYLRMSPTPPSGPGNLLQKGKLLLVFSFQNLTSYFFRYFCSFRLRCFIKSKHWLSAVEQPLISWSLMESPTSFLTFLNGSGAKNLFFPDHPRLETNFKFGSLFLLLHSDLKWKYTHEHLHTVAQLHSYTVTQWRSDAVTQWRSDAVTQWRSYAVSHINAKSHTVTAICTYIDWHT